MMVLFVKQVHLQKVGAEAEAIPRRRKMVERRGIGFMIGNGSKW